jgi:signal transduction histidine kinase
MLKTQMLGPIGKVAYVSYATDIHASGVRLRDTVNSILDIARIEGGRYDLEEDAVSLPEAIEYAVGAVADAAQQKGTEIENSVVGTFPSLRADARAIQNVLVNLLSNAVKFTGEEGRVAVSGGLDSSGDWLVAITDNGIGIPQDHLDKVVKPFYQADGSMVRKYEGVGLGLSLAAGLMQLHGGSLTIASVPDAGTTVTLRFPADRVMVA